MAKIIIAFYVIIFSTYAHGITCSNVFAKRNGMERKSLAVFDVDGTITREGSDSWFELTQTLTTDPAKFQEALEVWKEKKYNDPYGESLKMMEVGVELFAKEANSPYLVKKAKEHFIENMKAEGFIRAGAIEAIQRNHKMGRIIIFATTSYREVGVALVDVLKSFEYLDKAIQIHVSGTDVNWETRRLTHFNMGEGKIDGIARVLDPNKKGLQGKIVEAFGDDPNGNDSGILREALKAFVITTEKNSKVDVVPLNAKRVDW